MILDDILRKRTIFYEISCCMPGAVKIKMSKFKRKRKKDKSEYRNFEEDTQIITQLAA